MLRRFVNYLALVIIAASLTYALAAISLNPRANFEGRNPKPSAASVTATLNEYNLNPDTPLLVRFGHWAGVSRTATWGGPSPAARSTTSSAAGSA